MYTATRRKPMDNDLGNAEDEVLDANGDAGEAGGEVLETQSKVDLTGGEMLEMDVASCEMLETKAKFVRKRGRGRGREKRQRLRESTTEMHEAIDEAEEIKKKVEKVMKNA